MAPRAPSAKRNSAPASNHRGWYCVWNEEHGVGWLVAAGSSLCRGFFFGVNKNPRYQSGAEATSFIPPTSFSTLGTLLAPSIAFLVPSMLPETHSVFSVESCSREAAE